MFVRNIAKRINLIPKSSRQIAMSPECGQHLKSLGIWNKNIVFNPR